MQRRDFITLLGGAAAAWPRTARAQQRSTMPVIGYLHASSPEASADDVVAFRKGLSEAGYVEGQNVAIEYRWANSAYDRMSELGTELVRRRVAVMVLPSGVAAALAVKPLTATIPVVFTMIGDPVELGLVASLNRPGGNMTGISDMAVEIAAKRLGLLHELVPRATRFAVLVNSTAPAVAEPVTRNLRAAAAAIGREIAILPASDDGEIAAAFASLVQMRADGLVVAPDTLFLRRRVQIFTLAARHAVPAIYSTRDYAEAGGLMSYGSNRNDRERLAGIYTGRILKGEKPADLPVLQPTKFEFVINLQTARAIGIDVPATLLAIADEVIE